MDKNVRFSIYTKGERTAVVGQVCQQQQQQQQQQQPRSYYSTSINWDRI
jgi:hypothetical protein